LSVDATLVSAASDIRSYVIDQFMFGQGGEQLSNQDSLLQKGILDSMGVLELVAFIEKRFGVKVEDDEMLPANLDSVNKVADFVSRKVR
jgi:acyl carrier protein